MGSVLVISSSNTDLVCRAPRLPRSGETLVGSAFSTFAGGKGANQAVAAARAGARVSFAGAVGDDQYGATRLAELREEGVDVTYVEIIPNVVSGVALIIVDDVGENQIVMVPGANGSVGSQLVRRVLAGVGHDVLSLNLEIPFEAVHAAVRANAGTAPVVLNAAPFDPQVSVLLNQIDILICNEIEAGELAGGSVTLESAPDAARQIQEMGCERVVITLGRQGAVLVHREGVEHVPSPVVTVVDTTGAGDAFCGAFNAWFADGQPVIDAVRAGVSAGSLAVTRDGAQPSLPRRDEIIENLPARS